MVLKLQIVRDDKIVFEMPLSSTDWPREKLADEVEAFEDDFQKISKMFNALANETRFMMMKQLITKENRPINFSDFMRDLDLNPKLVWENTRKLTDGGLLKKIGRGRYRCSEFGETGFIMSLAIKRLIEIFEDFDEFTYPSAWTLDYAHYEQNREYMVKTIRHMMSNYESYYGLLTDYCENQIPKFFHADALIEAIFNES